MIRFMIFKLYSYKRNLFVFNTTYYGPRTVLCVLYICTNTIVQQIRSDCLRTPAYLTFTRNHKFQYYTKVCTTQTKTNNNSDGYLNEAFDKEVPPVPSLGDGVLPVPSSWFESLFVVPVVVVVEEEDELRHSSKSVFCCVVAGVLHTSSTGGQIKVPLNPSTVLIFPTSARVHVIVTRFLFLDIAVISNASFRHL